MDNTTEQGAENMSTTVAIQVGSFVKLTSGQVGKIVDETRLPDPRHVYLVNVDHAYRWIDATDLDRDGNEINRHLHAYRGY